MQGSSARICIDLPPQPVPSRPQSPCSSQRGRGGPGVFYCYCYCMLDVGGCVGWDGMGRKEGKRRRRRKKKREEEEGGWELFIGFFLFGFVQIFLFPLYLPHQFPPPPQKQNLLI